MPEARNGEQLADALHDAQDDGLEPAQVQVDRGAGGAQKHVVGARHVPIVVPRHSPDGGAGDDSLTVSSRLHRGFC